MSLLSKLPAVVGIWEPFHINKGVVPNRWGARPHPEALKEEDMAILEDVLAGRRVNAWTCSRTSLSEALRASQVLIKYVRGNHLLPLMLDTWSFKHKPILLMRHPLDVATSQVKAFGVRSRELDVAHLFPGHTKLLKLWPDIRQVKDPVERQLHVWCLVNARLWETMSNDDRVIAVHYHDLILDPEHHLKDVLRQWDWVPPGNHRPWSLDSFVSGLDLRATSDTDFGGDFLANQHDQLWKNLSALDREAKTRYQGVLDQHGFSMYSMDDVNPKRM